MKKFFTSIICLMTVAGVSAEEYKTAGEGKAYTLAKISSETEAVKAEGNIYTVNKDFTLAEGDTLLLQNGEQMQFADGVCITVDGVLNFQPETSAIVTRASEEATPKGFRVTGDNAELLMKNVVTEYVAFNCMSTKPVMMENCVVRFAGTALTSTGAVAILKETAGNIFRNCSFIQNESCAIGGNANAATGITIENCYFYDNNTQNTNKPQLNLIGGGNNPVIIRNCAIIGTGRDMVGGIGFMNYFVNGTNNYLIENNVITGNRYGIGAYSYSYPLHFQFINNKIVNNNAETNPNNGGSGISLYDYGNGMMNAVATGNVISGNLWGVTILGNVGSINFGKTDSSEAEDYNPGGNIFSNNGNGGVLYDFFNNTSNNATIYAQGNIWGVEKQTSEEIGKVVWDSRDEGGKGTVIYDSKNTPTGINTVSGDKLQVSGDKLQVSDSTLSYSLSGTRASANSRGIIIQDGKKVLK